MISTRITSLHGSQLSFVVFACKTAALVPGLQVYMGRRPHQWFFAFKTVTLASELQVSMFSVLICGFLHSKEQHYDQN